MSCLGSCPFQQILYIKSSGKVTLFTFNKVSFVRNTSPTITFLYSKLIKWREQIEESNITFWYRAELSLYLNNKNKDYLLHGYWAMSRLHIKVPMHLTVKLSENNFYHHKSSCKQQNMLKNVLAIKVVDLVS